MDLPAGNTCRQKRLADGQGGAVRWSGKLKTLRAWRGPMIGGIKDVRRWKALVLDEDPRWHGAGVSLATGSNFY